MDIARFVNGHYRRCHLRAYANCRNHFAIHRRVHTCSSHTESKHGVLMRMKALSNHKE